MVLLLVVRRLEVADLAIRPGVVARVTRLVAAATHPVAAATHPAAVVIRLAVVGPAIRLAVVALAIPRVTARPRGRLVTGRLVVATRPVAACQAHRRRKSRTL